MTDEKGYYISIVYRSSRWCLQETSMKKLKTERQIVFISLVLLLTACTTPDSNQRKEAPDVHEVNQFLKNGLDLPHRDTIYIPIYSEIHMEHDTRKLRLTVTLSIRNTSQKDTIYLESINQYNAKGKVVQQYLDETMFLSPMQSTNYVIEEDESEMEVEGSFIINWGAKNTHVMPLFQAVMISAHGPQGISFVTEGVSLSRKVPE